MATVRYTGGGTYRVGGHSFEPGDERDVDDGLAEYLDGVDDFDVVGVSEEEVEVYEFPDGEQLRDLNVGEVEDRLESGNFDHLLDEIESAEEHGKGRSTVFDAIDSRREG